MKKIFLSLLCTLAPLGLHAESLDSTISEQVKQMLPYSYQHRANIFQTHHIRTKIQEDYTLPWFANDKPNEERANIILNSISKEPDLSIKKGAPGSNNLFLNTRFEVYPSFTYAGNIEAKIIKPSLANTKQKDFRAKIILKEELDKDSPKRTLFAEIEFELKKATERDLKLLKGPVELNLIAETGYNNTLITPKDIGKIFTLDGIKHEVIDILNNTIILKVEDNEKKLNYQLINLDEKKDLISPKEPQDKVNYEENKIQYVYKKEYELFKSNLQLSETEYSSALGESFKTASLESQEKSGSTDLVLNKPFTNTTKEVFNKHLGEQYLVVKFLASSKHNYLYISKTIEKEITVTY